ncbi:Heat shock like protein SSE1 [Nosema granulosis]|uniref:Heat shock like protein SSE1 n=1 Tax=Nosema granulosis TaxID=83296 RepID=A0A9P6KXN7_9MICR|nr:Heat shock like protein SSE1 [Nosema granulosis]
MEFIGIDLGAYKTVIASSRDNGKIITDEQGKRSIRTVMELTKPIRKFGNSITGEHELTIDLRHRGFVDGLTKTENAKSLFMWLKYIDRTIKKYTTGNPTICFAIPSYFGEVERRVLLALAEASNMKIRGFFNDISAVGMFACIRREKTQKKFMIIDFGHHKTEVGVFEFNDSTFKPVYINSTEVGAEKFDEKLVDFIIHKYNLENKKIVREKIERSLEKVKTVLNASPTASTQAYITETPLNVQITQEEFSIIVKDEVEKIAQFIDSVLEETKFEGVVEVTGGNSSSFLIKGILDKKVKYQSTLDLTESCAIGSSLGFACSVIKSKFTINDILGRDIYIRHQGETEKKSLVFKSSDLLNTSKAVTYNKKGSFNLEVLEGEKVVASLEIVKEETEEPEQVKIFVELTRFGTVEVKTIEANSTVSHKYKVCGVSEEQIKEIEDAENTYRFMEESIEKIGTMRNDLETMAMNLADILSSKFDNLFSSEEIDKIRNIGFELFDIQQSTTIEEEEKVKQEVLSKFDFVSNKLNAHWDSVKTELLKYKEQIQKFNTENPKVFTPTFYKLQGLLYKIEDKVKTEAVDLYNIASYEYKFLEQFGSDLKTFIARSKKEIKEKLEQDRLAEEKKKQEEERAKKSKEEAKEEDANEKTKEDANKEEL